MRKHLGKKVRMNFNEFQAHARKSHYTNYMGTMFSKLSIRISFLFAHTPITPNQLTAMSAILGLTGAALIQDSNYPVRILGIILWFLAYILDFSDGEIARFRNLSSEFGHWFDGITDRIKDIGLYIAIAILALGRWPSPLVVIFGMLALGGTLLHSYATTFGYKSTTKAKEGRFTERFGGINYAIMAVLVALEQPEILLVIVALDTLVSLALNVLSSHKESLHTIKHE